MSNDKEKRNVFNKIQGQTKILNGKQKKTHTET